MVEFELRGVAGGWEQARYGRLCLEPTASDLPDVYLYRGRKGLDGCADGPDLPDETDVDAPVPVDHGEEHHHAVAGGCR